ncbi:hypothetical protein C8R46DRAFT_1023797 [Mycena filopes]|nr:hypothetical protein C8R46DRAFT_1023797 [Mycena filopes]
MFLLTSVVVHGYQLIKLVEGQLTVSLSSTIWRPVSDVTVNLWWRRILHTSHLTPRELQTLADKTNWWHRQTGEPVLPHNLPANTPPLPHPLGLTSARAEVGDFPNHTPFTSALLKASRDGACSVEELAKSPHLQPDSSREYYELWLRALSEDAAALCVEIEQTVKVAGWVLEVAEIKQSGFLPVHCFLFKTGGEAQPMPAWPDKVVVMAEGFQHRQRTPLPEVSLKELYFRKLPQMSRKRSRFLAPTIAHNLTEYTTTALKPGKQAIRIWYQDCTGHPSNGCS